MIYGYARVLTDGRSVTAQVDALTAAGGARVFRKTASGAKINRRQLRRVIDHLATRDLLDNLAEIARKGAGFRSLADTWPKPAQPAAALC